MKIVLEKRTIVLRRFATIAGIAMARMVRFSVSGCSCNPRGAASFFRFDIREPKVVWSIGMESVQVAGYVVVYTHDGECRFLGH